MLNGIPLYHNEPCSTILKNTVQNITAYNCREDISASPIVFYQVLSIFGLIKEAMGTLYKQQEGLQFGNNQVIAYIHENIYTPNLVQVKAISQHFNIAPSYFSAWFKRNFKLSYRDYMNNLRTKLIEKRVSAGNIPIKQIAHEFGFADESHFSNYFKKKKQVRPSDMQKRAKA